MQFFVGAILQFFWFLVFSGITYFIKLIGFGLVTYTGLNFATDTILEYVMANFSGIPANILGVMGLLGIDKAFNIILTVMSVRMLHMGMQSGSKTTVAWKKPADLNAINGIFRA